MPRGRRESYERILSQENLDHRVVAFIYSLFSLSHLLSGGVSYTSGSLFLPFALNFRTGNVDQVDDDSAYGQSPSPLMDNRLSIDNKDVNSSDSPQNSPSLGWDDISVYNAKKKQHAWYQAPDGS